MKEEEEEKKKTKTPNETETNNLPDKGFKAIVVRMLMVLGKRIDEHMRASIKH